MITKVTDLKEKEVVPGIRGKFVHSDNMTVVYWSIDAGAVMPDHAHPHEQIVNVLEGEFDFTVEGKVHEAKPGFIAVVPSNVKHGGKAKSTVRILDVFYPVREDYRE
ncbi:cupin [candidate division WOR_3 bacterium SM23_42]|uniref:Cupin n=1 Tax=candidate division WOR_3 bacterium SM23_42 TaxID=1703779 RepID=A0A0S8FVW1_UNCW3|nr:MAG: cupin [candidate division WOR_3 bacterium SM23_42]